MCAQHDLENTIWVMRLSHTSDHHAVPRAGLERYIWVSRQVSTGSSKDSTVNTAFQDQHV